MTGKRRAAILASLEKGNWITRSWSGGNGNGYLKHTLFGVRRLRETEVEELRKDGFIDIVTAKEFQEKCGYHRGTFAPFKLKLVEKSEGEKNVSNSL